MGWHLLGGRQPYLLKHRRNLLRAIHSDGNPYANFISGCNSYAERDSDCYSYAHAFTYCYANCYCHTYAYFNGEAHTDAKNSANTQGSPYSATASVAFDTITTN